jgi:hypothetical protein
MPSRLLLLTAFFGAALANLPDPRNLCLIRQSTTARLAFRPKWEWDHAKCPLPPPGVVPGGREDKGQAIMRQARDIANNPVGVRQWKTDITELPDGSSTAGTCAATRPSNLMCVQGGIDAPLDAPVMCLIHQQGSDTCQGDGCGTECMWDNVPTSDGGTTLGTIYTYRHLRNYKNEACLVAKEDIQYSAGGQVRFEIKQGEPFDDYVIARRPSMDIAGDIYSGTADGTKDQIVMMDFCLDDLDGYYEIDGWDEIEDKPTTEEVRVNVGIADFFASAHFPCSKSNCGMMDVESQFADTFNQMFTIALGFVPSAEFRDKREYKDENDVPFGGLAEAIDDNDRRMAENTAHPWTPNILAAEHGKILPGHTPMYGTLLDIVDRLGLCGNAPGAQIPCSATRSARYPGFDGTYSDKHCDGDAATCPRSHAGDWSETSWNCGPDDCDKSYCAGTYDPISDPSLPPASIVTCSPELAGLVEPGSIQQQSLGYPAGYRGAAQRAGAWFRPAGAAMSSRSSIPCGITQSLPRFPKGCLISRRWEACTQSIRSRAPTSSQRFRLRRVLSQSRITRRRMRNRRRARVYPRSRAC